MSITRSEFEKIYKDDILSIRQFQADLNTVRCSRFIKKIVINVVEHQIGPASIVSSGPFTIITKTTCEVDVIYMMRFSRKFKRYLKENCPEDFEKIKGFAMIDHIYEDNNPMKYINKNMRRLGKTRAKLDRALYVIQKYNELVL